MGLDITAYAGLSPVNVERDEDGYPVDDENGDIIIIYANPGFPGRHGKLIDQGAYRAIDSMGFRAGSYGGYNAWRRQLAEMAGYTPESIWDKETPSPLPPFYELVNFSDCEGTLGTEVASRLLGDFDAHQDEAEHFGDEYFWQRYRNWHEALRLAANNGAVCFH